MLESMSHLLNLNLKLLFKLKIYFDAYIIVASSNKILFNGSSNMSSCVKKAYSASRFILLNNIRTILLCITKSL